MSAPGLRPFAGELLGTLVLVATVVGSGIMGERLADGSVALALLGNTVATGAILVVLITAIGPVSGAHFNPAVTLVFAVRGEIMPGAALGYVGAQILGGMLGVILAHAMFDLPLLAAGVTARTGPAQWLGEATATLLLVLTILGVRAGAPHLVAPMVGLVITAGYWFTSSTSFANPAVSLARAFTPSFSGIRPEDAVLFILVQLVAAVAALALAQWLFRLPGGRPAVQDQFSREA